MDREIELMQIITNNIKDIEDINKKLTVLKSYKEKPVYYHSSVDVKIREGLQFHDPESWKFSFPLTNEILECIIVECKNKKQEAKKQIEEARLELKEIYRRDE